MGDPAAAQRPADDRKAKGAAEVRSPAPPHAKGGARQDSSAAAGRRVVQKDERTPQARVSRDGASASREQRAAGYPREKDAEDATLLAKRSQHPATGSLPHGTSRPSDGDMQRQDQAELESADPGHGYHVIETTSPGNPARSLVKTGDQMQEQPLERRIVTAAAAESRSVSRTQLDHPAEAERQTAVVTADLRLTCSIPAAAQHTVGTHAAEGRAARSSGERCQVGFSSLLEPACRSHR